MLLVIIFFSCAALPAYLAIFRNAGTPLADADRLFRSVMHALALLHCILYKGARTDPRRYAVLSDRDQTSARLCDRVWQPCELLLRFWVRVLMMSGRPEEMAGVIPSSSGWTHDLPCARIMLSPSHESVCMTSLCPCLD